MGTRLIYIADIRFPMERANAIQSINTAYALARSGTDVHFLVRKTDKRSDEQCLDYYGLKPHKNLTLHRLPVVNSHGSYLLWKVSFLLAALIKTFLLGFHRGKVVYYTRDLRIASIFNIIKHLFRARLLFEAHTVNYRNFQEIHILYENKGKLSERKIQSKRRKEKRVYKRVDGVIVITEHLKRQLEFDFSPKCPVVVIRDSADPLPKPSQRSGQTGVCYVGQLYPWKGVDVLLRAMSMIPSEGLFIVGGLEYENDLASLKGLAEELKIAERVKFIGTVPHKKVAEYIEKAKVCVLPLPFSQIAAYYTSPLKLFEYLAAGKAIVASKLPSIEEVLRDGENAILSKPGDFKSLALALNKVLRDDKLRHRLEANAWKESHAYSWSVRADAIKTFIAEIILQPEIS